MNELGRGVEGGAALPHGEARRPRVAIVVPNPCNPDFRVIKQAEFLARQGYEVRVFCTQAKDVPTFETFNDVVYRRFEWHVAEGLWRLLGLGPPDTFAEIRARRAKFMRKYRSFFGKDTEGSGE